MSLDIAKSEIELITVGLGGNGSNTQASVNMMQSKIKANVKIAQAEKKVSPDNQKGNVGIPVSTSKNPLSPVQQRDAHGNEIVYRTMSEKQFEIFRETGVMPPTTETSFSPVLRYSSKYNGVTVKIVLKPGTSDELQKIGIAANSAAAKILPNMSTQTGEWMQTNTRFKVEGGQMTTQLGQGKGLEIFNNNIIKFEKVR